MKLADLDGTRDIDIVLLQTASVKLQIYLLDKLKLKYSINQDTSLSISNKSDFKAVKNLLGVYTPNGGYWLVTVNLDNFRDMKELCKVINNASTCIFFVTCSKYSQFKGFKEQIDKNKIMFDFYINYLTRYDLVYLYDSLVPSNNKLNQGIFNFLAMGYLGNVEEVMTLLQELNKGTKITTKKELIELCGIGGNSVEGLLFSLLKEISGSDKGLKTVIKNRLTVGLDLADSLGIRTFYNYFNRALDSFIQIKQLMISGAIYDCIRNLPDSYDEKTLVRYNRYIYKIKEIPLSDLIRIKNCLNKRWGSELDFISFIYRYYELQAIRKVGKLNVNNV